MSQKLIYVAGEGNLNTAQIAIVGEAPGAEEEIQGFPFSGRSGQLLRGILEKLDVNVARDLYITNLVKVRPEDNRTPTQAESDSWVKSLAIELKSVKVIIALGATSSTAIERNKHLFPQIVYNLSHPAYILRNRSKLPAYESSIESVIYSAYREVVGDIYE